MPSTISCARDVTSRRRCSPARSAPTWITACSSTATRRWSSRERATVSASVGQYQEVLGILREQIAALRPDDLARPTPCSEWDGLALVAHALGAMAYYARLAGGDDKVRPVTVDLEPGDDLVERFDDAAARGVEAWSQPGALDGQVKMVLGRMPGRDALAVHIGDLAIHAW